MRKIEIIGTAESKEVVIYVGEVTHDGNYQMLKLTGPEAIVLWMKLHNSLGVDGK